MLIISFGISFLFFFSFNAYAANEEYPIKIKPAWEETKTFQNIINMVANLFEDNMGSRGGLEDYNVATRFLSYLFPEILEGGDALAMANNNIPKDLQRGLLGMTFDMNEGLYANYPTFDVPEHLAQQWVPGYSDQTNKLYADSGYNELSKTGIDVIWTRVLNISYVVFVLIMIAAGFMIMFRNKLGGQTIVTLGNVLPRVIISLIIATFSFAIAGLIIDLGGVMNGIVLWILDVEDPTPISTLGNLIKATFNSGSGLAGTLSDFLQGIGLDSFTKVATASTVAGVVALVAIFSNPVTGAIGFVGIILVISAIGIILFGAIKVLITLFKAYFSLLFAVISGPIQITLGAIPGNNKFLTNWFLSIVRNVLVFPMVLFIIYLPNVLNSVQTGDMSLSFPAKLVGDPNGMPVNLSAGIFIAVLKVLSLYFAAQAPKYLEAWLPADSSRAMGEASKNVKDSLSKIPLVGGLFKG